MIGRDDSTQSLGIIPCAIAWLFRLINERKEKTGARFSVRISAVEVWGKEEKLRDLLAEVATGSLQDGQSPGVYLCEDPICGTQVTDSSGPGAGGLHPRPRLEPPRLTPGHGNRAAHTCLRPRGLDLHGRQVRGRLLAHPKYLYLGPN